MAADPEGVVSAQTEDRASEHPPTATMRGTLAATAPAHRSGVHPIEGEAAGLHILGIVATGGMGLIQLAAERTLGREVAVKTVKYREPEFESWLAHEARITSRIQHPSVVPVYALRFDESAGPQMVMPHIQGEALNARMPIRFEDEDHVLDLLDAFTRICEAIEYAHSRSIVHLDIKPENVMVGNFGEIYIVDWGIAMSLDARERGSLRTVEECKETVGTPAYLAPEMLNPSLAPGIGRHTDVYLLGGLLYAMCTGRPPHRGSSSGEILSSLIDRHPIEFPEDVPEPLRAICLRAMAHDPDDRYASVEELRLDVRQYQRRRSSYATAHGAAILLKQLEDIGADAEDLAATYRVFGECRFGFTQALKQWPDNEVAARGLERAYWLMIDRHLAKQAYQAADRLADEGMGAIPRPSEEYRAFCRELTEKRRAHDERHALRPGREARRAFFIRFGVISMVTVGSFWVLHHTGILPFTTMHLLGLTLLIAVGANISWYQARDTLFPNQATRAILGAHIAMDITLLIASIVFVTFDVPLSAALALHLSFFACGFSVLGFATSRWLVWAGVAHLPFVFAIVLVPEFALTWAAIAYPGGVFAHAWASGSADSD